MAGHLLQHAVTTEPRDVGHIVRTAELWQEGERPWQGSSTHLKILQGIISETKTGGAHPGETDNSQAFSNQLNQMQGNLQ
jgi:hypothetical protein